MGAVTATITVQFANQGDGKMSAEIDGRPAGFNAGRTSFSPGDEVYILVHKSPNVNIIAAASTLGTLTPVNTTRVQVAETLTFARERTATLGKTPAGAVSQQWVGNNLGAVTIKGSEVSLVTFDPNNPGIGVLLIEYESEASVYRLSGIPSSVNGKTSFDVLAVFVGEFQ